MKGCTLALLTAIIGLALNYSGKAGQPESGCPPKPCKVCVSVPKGNTRKVYSCAHEDYCLPRCCCLSKLRGKCDCDKGKCGKVRVRHRLVVKKVPDCQTRQCVPCEVPAIQSDPCQPPLP